MKDEKYIGTSLTEEEHRSFAIEAAKRGTKPRALLRVLARQFLNRNGVPTTQANAAGAAYIARRLRKEN